VEHGDTQLVTVQEVTVPPAEYDPEGQTTHEEDELL